jgi:hypothetical protein
VDFTTLRNRFESAEGLFTAAGDLVRQVGGRTPLSLPGRRPIALPAGSPAQEPPERPDESREGPHGAANDAVTAYLRAVQAKLGDWFASRPHQVASADFDDFYFREVHPAAKAALLRHLTPHAPAGHAARPPRLRSLPTAERSPGGVQDVL